jgi:hypothetical protein
MLSVITTFLKMLSVMEITKYSHNLQSTLQYFNLGCSKSCHLQSGSFFGAFVIPKWILPSTHFSIDTAFEIFAFDGSFKNF